MVIALSYVEANVKSFEKKDFQNNKFDKIPYKKIKFKKNMKIKKKR